jgi:hypothetical protein
VSVLSVESSSTQEGVLIKHTYSMTFGHGLPFLIEGKAYLPVDQGLSRKGYPFQVGTSAMIALIMGHDSWSHIFFLLRGEEGIYLWIRDQHRKEYPFRLKPLL